MNNSKNERMKTHPELFVNCQRCEQDIEKGKTPTVSLKEKTMYFCDNCFKSVFKYDESLKTVPMIWQENGMKTPFIIRSSNWHRSSYMVIKEVNTTEGSEGKQKTVFVGDMYLRGNLKEQGRPIGKANYFLWTPWSAELAEKYREEIKPEGATVPG
ncbi:MAG: hypothetical protein ACYC7D_10465 [Nitrososphaerales archaeon]